MTQVRPLAESLAAPSSPIIPSSGRSARSRSTSKRSEARSASDTGSVAVDLVFNPSTLP